MKHLTEGQRYEISAFLRAGFSKSQIAKELGVHKSTITREIQRNGYGSSKAYYPREAHKRASRRWRRRDVRRAYDQVLKNQVRYYMAKRHLSPEQIVGYCRVRGVRMVSHETIYKWVWQDKRCGGDLYKYLRHKGRKYVHRGATNNSRRHIPDAVDISLRPPEVDARSRFGDFEIDTIVGKNRRQHILTIVERKTGLLIMRRLRTPTAAETASQLIDALSFLAGRGFVKTITADNGLQFSRHALVTSAIGAVVYFARPYHSWERGTNENTNGLIREYLPKGCDFDEFSDQELERIQKELNIRPRKRLGFSTPYDELKKITKIDAKVAFAT